MGKIKRISNKVNALQEKLYELEQLALEEPEHLKETLTETFERLHGGLEELQVAMEEMRHQNYELISGQQTLESERQRYKELFKLAPYGYVVTDTTGIIEEANRAAADLLSVDQEFLTGTPLVVFVSEENRKDFYDLLNQMKKNGASRTLESISAAAQR